MTVTQKADSPEGAPAVTYGLSSPFGGEVRA
jgi:hypothetical protein